MDIEEKKAIDFLKKISNDLNELSIDTFLVNIDRTKKSIDILLKVVKEQEEILNYLTR